MADDSVAGSADRHRLQAGGRAKGARGGERWRRQSQGRGGESRDQVAPQGPEGQGGDDPGRRRRPPRPRTRLSKTPSPTWTRRDPLLRRPSTNSKPPPRKPRNNSRWRPPRPLTPPNRPLRRPPRRSKRRSTGGRTISDSGGWDRRPPLPATECLAETLPPTGSSASVGQNAAVFIGPLFALKLGDWNALRSALVVFAGFCLISSASYAINDAPRPRSRCSHPHKCRRPVACGAVPVGAAFVFAGLLLAGRRGPRTLGRPGIRQLSPAVGVLRSHLLLFTGPQAAAHSRCHHPRRRIRPAGRGGSRGCRRRRFALADRVHVHAVHVSGFASGAVNSRRSKA